MQNLERLKERYLILKSSETDTLIPKRTHDTKDYYRCETTFWQNLIVNSTWQEFAKNLDNAIVGLLWNWDVSYKYSYCEKTYDSWQRGKKQKNFRVEKNEKSWKNLPKDTNVQPN